jgi:hypothetical protein
MIDIKFILILALALIVLYLYTCVTENKNFIQICENNIKRLEIIIVNQAKHLQSQMKPPTISIKPINHILQPSVQINDIINDEDSDNDYEISNNDDVVIYSNTQPDYKQLSTVTEDTNIQSIEIPNSDTENETSPASASVSEIIEKQFEHNKPEDIIEEPKTEETITEETITEETITEETVSEETVTDKLKETVTENEQSEQMKEKEKEKEEEKKGDSIDLKNLKVNEIKDLATKYSIILTKDINGKSRHKTKKELCNELSALDN